MSVVNPYSTFFKYLQDIDKTVCLTCQKHIKGHSSFNIRRHYQLMHGIKIDALRKGKKDKKQKKEKKEENRHDDTIREILKMAMSNTTIQVYTNTYTYIFKDYKCSNCNL